MVWEASIDSREIQKAIKLYPDTIFQEIRKAFVTILARFERDHKLKYMRGRPGVFARTGTLRRSFMFKVFGKTLAELNGIYFSDSVYARIHEEGGLIRPTRSRYLAIPLDAVKTPSGVPRGSPRDFPNTFIRRKGGSLLIMQTQGERAVPLFALVSSVTIPPRLNLVEFWNSRQRDHVEIVRQAARTALERISA